MSNVIYVKTTDTCNLSCDHCFTNGFVGKVKPWDYKPTAEWVIDLISERNEEFTHIEFHGGEPMLIDVRHLKDFKEIVEASVDGDLSFGMTTNLVYKLTDEKLKFIVEDLSKTVATSWDPKSRFKTDRQLKQWSTNLNTLKEKGVYVKLFVSLTKAVIDMGAKKVIEELSNYSFSIVDFERITLDGDAVNNASAIKPDNKDVDSFMYEIYTLYVNGGIPFKILTIDTILEGFKTKQHLGTNCRNCESNLFTINSNGTVGGCPNGATKDNSKAILPAVKDYLVSEERVARQIKEMTREDGCISCPVFDVCGGDCYKTNWDETGCPGYKSILRDLKFNSRKNLIEIVEV